MKLETKIGLLFILLALMPIGIYHYEDYENKGIDIVGLLYGFKFPYGIVALIFGLSLVFYNKITFLKKINSNYIITTGGILILMSALIIHSLLVSTNKQDIILEIWHGVAGDYDTEINNKLYFLSNFAFSILSIFIGIKNIKKKK